MQTSLRTSLQHTEHRGLRTDGKEHEDGEHAPCRDVIAIHESQSVGDRVPHAIERSARSAELREPFREGDVVQIADHVHASVKVEQGAYDGGSSQPQRVVEFILDAELFRFGKGLKTTHGSADGETKVEGTKGTSLVHEGVHVFLDAQFGIERSGTLHDAEEVVIAAEEDVKAHFDVIPLLILPRGDFSSHERAEFEHFDIVSGIGKVHCGDHAGQASSDNTDFELFLVLFAGSVLGTGHKVLVEEGIVADLFLCGFRFEVGIGGGGRRRHAKGRSPSRERCGCREVEGRDGGGTSQNVRGGCCETNHVFPF
mmetsp:Transcript_22946/g.48391  ORF Transcript_22946/g.48391 Transcript_22946/m.48391 type:complete len:312 (-) Transcript_22946:138-1073(-)